MPLQGEGDNHGKTDMRESLKSDSFKLLHRLDSEESFYDQEFDTEIESKNSNEKTSEAENSRRRFTSNDDPKPNLIVNYLPQTLSDKDFFNLFIPYGKLESIKIMRDSQVNT
jgi:RNA recognition motif-containing protein